MAAACLRLLCLCSVATGYISIRRTQPDGRVFYFNPATGRTQYERPTHSTAVMLHSQPSLHYAKLHGELESQVRYLERDV